MSKKQPFEPKPLRQLLRSTFQNVNFISALPLLTFHNDQMLGCIYVERADRISLISSYVENFEDADDHGQDDNVTFMMPNEYEFICNEAKPFKFQLGYGLVVDQTKNTSVILESFDSVLVIKYIDETAGFIKFNLESKQMEDTVHFNIQLENFFLLAEYRDKLTWLDLTTALSNFLSVTLLNIVHSINKNEKIKVTLLSSINKIGGKIIAEFIYRELSFLLEYIASVNKDMKKSLSEIEFAVIN